jgi:SAM-dependent methyltransferase
MTPQTSIESLSHEWESYWATVDGNPGEIFWDADLADSTEDLTLIGDLFDRRLPLLDVGCGNGRQARFFANHFDRVIGVDISAAAVARARAVADARTISYQLLDLYRPIDAQRLHEEVGDANVYVRWVLHGIPPVYRDTAVRSIERLLGDEGTLYLKEPSPAAEHYIRPVIEGHEPPPGLTRTFIANLLPGTFSEQDRATLFPPDRFRFFAHGTTSIRTVNHFPSGRPITMPALYALLRRHY